MEARIGRGRATFVNAARRLITPLALVVALAFMLGVPGGASAGAVPFPDPTCGWVPASLVTRTFGDPVRMAAPQWTTSFAPVLSCRYVERRPRVQLGDVAMVVVRFAEYQGITPQSGAVPVKRLGKCLSVNACPDRHPAWLYVQSESAHLSKQTADVTGVDLSVQDGLNSIEIYVANPYGPLGVANEAAQAESLARRLLNRFFWNDPLAG